jgi:hypothetical protein
MNAFREPDLGPEGVRRYYARTSESRMKSSAGTASRSRPGSAQLVS